MTTSSPPGSPDPVKTSSAKLPQRLPGRPRTTEGSETRTSTDNGGQPASMTPIPDDSQRANLPMPMSASVVLTDLPKDAHQALEDAGDVDSGKVTVRFHPLPSAPALQRRVFKVSASQKFETVVNFLRKKLNCKDTDSVFCYVNSVFAPGLDEGIGGLWRCFKTEDQLIVAYSLTPAFG